MFNNKKKSSGGSGWMLLAGLVGAGIGYAVSKLVQTNDNKQQKKQPIRNQQKTQAKMTTVDQYDDIQELMICPITHEVMTDPCILSGCGHTFQRDFIVNWVKKSGDCPLCKYKTKQTDIQTNFQLKSLITYYQKNKNNPKKQSKTEMQKPA